MPVIAFSNVLGTTQEFTAASDVFALTGDASDFTFANDGEGNLVVTDIIGNVVILSGFTLSQVTTTNVVFTGSSSNLLAGDNDVDTVNDDTAQVAAGPLDLVAAGGSNLDANNVIFGLGEGDIITVGAGNNKIYGGSGVADSSDGSDTITIDGSGTTSGSNLIYTNAGNDTILFTDPTGAGNTTELYAGIGNDDIVTGAAAGTMIIAGNLGNDTINAAGATGDMTIYGGDGIGSPTDTADLITSGLGNAAIFGNGDADTIYFDDFGSTASQTIYGGKGDDTILGDVGGAGSTGALTIFGNFDADTIDVRTHLGTTVVYGGAGSADSGDGADTILVGTGNAAHNATVYSNAGADTITSTAALAADETIVVYGGAGADTFNFSGARSATSNLTLFGNADSDIFNIDDSALIADATVTFSGFDDSDTLNLTLAGGSATDLELSGLGASVTINNGAANGNYVFSNYTGNFSATNFVISDGSVLLTNFGGVSTGLSGTANADQIIAGGEGDTLTGAAGDDILIGGDGADSIDGGDDVDTIQGGEGNDTITAGDGGADGGGADSSIDGGTGSDSIVGGAFEDSIDGGNGNDTIAGGADADTITGGNENDTFEYAVAEVGAADTDVDLITDAFNGSDTFFFSDLTAGNLRGDGTDFASGAGTAAQALGANVGMYVATNAIANFAEATIYTGLAGIADDLLAADILYVMISDGTDARLVRITEAANAGTLVAVDDTLEFVARLSGVSNSDLGALVAGNFDNFV